MPAGRPTKLTPEVHSKIVQLVREWNYAQVAAAICEISEKTFYRWIEQGQAEESGIYADFCQAVKKAEGEAEHEAIGIVRKREPGWQAAAWYLERKHWQRYCRRDASRAEESSEDN